MFLFYTILFYFIPICVGGGLSNICFLHMSSMFKVRNKVSSISAVLKIKFQIMMSYTRCLNGQRLKLRHSFYKEQEVMKKILTLI